MARNCLAHHREKVFHFHSTVNTHIYIFNGGFSCKRERSIVQHHLAHSGDTFTSSLYQVNKPPITVSIWPMANRKSGEKDVSRISYLISIAQRLPTEFSIFLFECTAYMDLRSRWRFYSGRRNLSVYIDAIRITYKYHRHIFLKYDASIMDNRNDGFSLVRAEGKENVQMENWWEKYTAQRW